MTINYPNIDWLFSENSEMSQDFYLNYGSRDEYLRKLDFFLKEICEINSLDKVSVIEKIKNKKLDRDFFPFIAELRTIYLIEGKFEKIELLPDGYFEGKSPDLLCEIDDSKAYFEVTYISNSDSTKLIIDKLREILKDSPYCAKITFKDELASPSVNYQDKEIQSTFIEESIRILNSELLKEITVFPHEIDTPKIKFTLNKTKSGKGYPGIFISSYRFDSDNVMRYVEYRLDEKAKKPDKFPNDEKKHPYFIVLVCDELSIEDIEMEELLYGAVTEYGIFEDKDKDPEAYSRAYDYRESQWNLILEDKDQYIPKWSEIEEASKNGWKELLEKYCLIPREYSYLTKEGIFLSHNEMKNVSGVLFIRNYGEDRTSFFPNPFCREEINCQSISPMLMFDSIN